MHTLTLIRALRHYGATRPPYNMNETDYPVDNLCLHAAGALLSVATIAHVASQIVQQGVSPQDPDVANLIAQALSAINSRNSTDHLLDLREKDLPKGSFVSRLAGLNSVRNTSYRSSIKEHFATATHLSEVQNMLKFLEQNNRRMAVEDFQKSLLNITAKCHEIPDRIDIVPQCEEIRSKI